MLEITNATVVGATGATVEATDLETIRAAELLGYAVPDFIETADRAWYAAEFLRDVYAAVLATAGMVRVDVARVAATGSAVAA